MSALSGGDHTHQCDMSEAEDFCGAGDHAQLSSQVIPSMGVGGSREIRPWLHLTTGPSIQTLNMLVNITK